MPDHETGCAKLFISTVAVIAVTASDHIVEHNSIARLNTPSGLADGLNLAGDFVSQCERQGVEGRLPGPVVDIGMTDPGGSYPDQHITVADMRHRQLEHFERFSDPDHAYSSHLDSLVN
jgi:hypothetical protein